MDLKNFIKDLAAKLQAAGIDYCITGGYAVSVWGAPRSTLDIDLVAAIRRKQIPLFLKTMAPERGAYLDEQDIREAIDTGGEFNYIPASTGLKVDFWVITEKNHTGLLELKRKRKVVVDGQDVWFVSPEDLVLSKLRWARQSASSRHVEDIKSVLAASGKRLDLAYLRGEASDQGLGAELAKLLP